MLNYADKICHADTEKSHFYANKTIRANRCNPPNWSIYAKIHVSPTNGIMYNKKESKGKQTCSTQWAQLKNLATPSAKT